MNNIDYNIKDLYIGYFINDPSMEKHIFEIIRFGGKIKCREVLTRKVFEPYKSANITNSIMELEPFNVYYRKNNSKTITKEQLVEIFQDINKENYCQCHI